MIQTSHDVPRVKLFFILRRRACEVVNIDIDPGNVTVTDAGGYVGSTDVKEVWTQSPDGVLANVCDGLIHRGTKEKSSDQLVTDEDKTRN